MEKRPAWTAGDNGEWPWMTIGFLSGQSERNNLMLECSKSRVPGGILQLRCGAYFDELLVWLVCTIRRRCFFFHGSKAIGWSPRLQHPPTILLPEALSQRNRGRLRAKPETVEQNMEPDFFFSSRQVLTWGLWCTWGLCC